MRMSITPRLEIFEPGLYRMPEAGIVAFIEDPFIRKLLRDILTRHGYHVAEYSVQHALELLNSGAQPIYLLITNSPADFVEFADAIPLLYLAAAPDERVAAQFRRCRMVKKPFAAGDLLTAVRELTA